MTKILVGTWQGDEIVWQDQWTLMSPAIEKLLVTRVGYTGKTSQRSLMCMGWRGVFLLPIGADANPLRAPWPKLADYGESGVAQGTHMLWCSGVDMGDWARVKGKIKIDFPFLDGASSAYVYSWMDEDAEKVMVDGPFSERSIEARVTEEPGRVLNVAVGFIASSRRAAAPYIRDIVLPGGTWEYTDRPMKAAQASPALR